MGELFELGVSGNLEVITSADSFRRVWRRGERRGALMIGGSLLLYMVLLLVSGVIVDLALLPIPSFSFSCPGKHR